MKKKGVAGLENAVITAIGLAIGAVILVLFVNYGAQWGKGEIISKMNAANLVGLTIGELQSSPTDTIVDIRMDLSAYTISVDDKCVIITTMQGDLAKSQYCYPVTKQVIPTTLQRPKRVFLIKNTKGILLTDKVPEKVYLETCDPLIKDKSKTFKILIDPIFEEGSDNDFTLKISESLYSNLKSSLGQADITLASPRNRFDKVSADEITEKSRASDLVIKIKTIDSKQTSVYARAGKKSELANAVACNSLNNLMNIKSVRSISKND